ncbi:hypothetical protein BN2475_100006 [Paraburkholderia ribeironis]|uniref:Uncharacterized protein n=1 Tax=Paraburkholderia ribeironis TaxID=1247936 RepID=A0A1N7RP61_9BURK|nr:hypothetical protein BN2475_100006 [Paraburkholderia ribeironis]
MGIIRILGADAIYRKFPVDATCRLRFAWAQAKGKKKRHCSAAPLCPFRRPVHTSRR